MLLGVQPIVRWSTSSRSTSPNAPSKIVHFSQALCPGLSTSEANKTSPSSTTGQFDWIIGTFGSNPEKKASDASSCAASPPSKLVTMHASSVTSSSGGMAAISLPTGAPTSLEGLCGPGPIFALLACALSAERSGGYPPGPPPAGPACRTLTFNL